jgi:hypothetical protein
VVVTEAADKTLVPPELRQPSLPDQILLEDEVSIKNNTLTTWTNPNLLVDSHNLLSEFYRRGGVCHDDCIERLGLLLGV